MKKLRTITAAYGPKTSKQLEAALKKGIAELPNASKELESILSRVNNIYEKIDGLYADMARELDDLELLDCYYDYDINVAADQVSDLDSLSDEEYEALDALYSKFDDEAVKYDDLATQIESVKEDIDTHATSSRDIDI